MPPGLDRQSSFGSVTSNKSAARCVGLREPMLRMEARVRLSNEDGPLPGRKPPLLYPFLSLSLTPHSRAHTHTTQGRRWER